MWQTSDCGAKLLLTFVVFTFLIAFFLNLFTGIFFAFGAFGTKICPLFTEDELFTKIIDVPANFNNEYILGKAVLGNASYPLTVKSVLDNCRADATLWQSLQLTKRLNLTNLLDIQHKFNITTDLYSIPNVNGTVIIPPAATALATDYQSSGILTLDYSQVCPSSSLVYCIFICCSAAVVHEHFAAQCESDVVARIHGGSRRKPDRFPGACMLHAQLKSLLMILDQSAVVGSPVEMQTLITNTQYQVDGITNAIQVLDTINTLRTAQMTAILALEASAAMLNTTIAQFLAVCALRHVARS